MNEEQLELLRSLNLATDLEGLGEERLMLIEDKLADEIQLHGINSRGDGLNQHGLLCKSIIEAMP